MSGLLLGTSPETIFSFCLDVFLIQILPPHTVGQFLPFPLPLLGFPPSFPVHRRWAPPTMHCWPRPLTSLKALAPIVHVVVPHPVPAVSIVRPRPSAPPLAGPRSVRRVDLTGALDVSSLSPILVPLRGSLR